MADSAFLAVETRWGQALDFKYFPPENIIPFSKVQYAGGPIYTLALLGFKLSLLTSYLRIGGFILAYKYTIYAVIFLCTCNQIIFTLVITLACNPVCGWRIRIWALSCCAGGVLTGHTGLEAVEF